MKKIFTLFISVFCLCGLLPAQIEFVENKGQWEPATLFRAEFGGGMIRIEKNAFVYTYVEAFTSHDHKKEIQPGQTYNIQNVRVEFEGSSNNPGVAGVNKKDGYHNYFIGNDPSKWASRVGLFEKVYLSEIYPGIDLEVFASQSNSIKYNFIVHPGANPALIQLKYSGASSLRLKQGQLEINTIFGDVKEMAPLAYQLEGKKDPNVAVKYRLKGNVLTFDLEEDYNRTRELVIDPVVVFSTYSGSFSDNFGFTATYDFDGYAYTGGTVYGGNYPASPGVVQMTYGGGTNSESDLARDCGIMKLSPDGKRLEYKTFLGGALNEQPHSMVVDQQQNLIVFGSTGSDNFPNIGTGASNSLSGLSDIFVIKISRDGTQILGMTYIGGSKRDGLNGIRNSSAKSSSPLAYNYGDDYRGEVIVDKDNNVYFASCTESSAADGFPVKNSFNTTFSGAMDGCVFKLSPDLGQVLWGAYVGGNMYDATYGVALDNNKNVFVCGGTTTPGNPIGATGLIKSNNGATDGFVLKISNNGANLLAGTYIGTSTYDQCYFVQTDKFNNVYTTGQTDGMIPKFPSSVYYENGGGQFIYKLNNSLNTVELSSVYGVGNEIPQISLSAFMVDSCERIFVSGWGGEINETTHGGHGGNTALMTTTPDGFDRSSDGSDFYLAVFSKGMSHLVYATFLGGGTANNPLGEHVDGGTSRFDPKGIIYQGVCGGCRGRQDFPTTQGAYSRSNNSQNCNNAIFKMDYENLNQAPVVKDTLIVIDVGQTLDFNYTGYDPDVFDSVFIFFTGEAIDGPSFPDPHVKIGSKRSGLGNLSNNIRWKPSCANVGDTISINVFMVDRGCPKEKSDSALIRIVVTRPPVSVPPEVICLSFLNNDRLKLSWSGGDSTDYLDAYIILRKTGNGPWGVAATIPASAQKEWIDANAIGNNSTNYCYAFVARNVCGEYGDTSYIVCTLEQLANAVKSEEIIVTTVKDNKNTYTAWTVSTEEDFYSYLLYKRINDTKTAYEFVAEIKNLQENFYLDDRAKVDEFSYCYQLIIRDKCGQSSRPSNEGCSILLKGESLPYEHVLTWSPYRKWEFGVVNYTLWRYDDRLVKAPIGNGDSLFLAHNDTMLDYDWGGYWYQVVADENAGNGAVSESNIVYLVQRPLLHVPNAFTRNGDYLNDVWGISDVFVKDYKLLVYNRWGQKVLETNDKNYQWDGYFRSEDPFDNVFIWVVYYTGWDDSKHQQKGTLTILR